MCIIYSTPEDKLYRDSVAKDEKQKIIRNFIKEKLTYIVATTPFKYVAISVRGELNGYNDKDTAYREAFKKYGEGNYDVVQIDMSEPQYRKPIHLKYRNDLASKIYRELLINDNSYLERFKIIEKRKKIRKEVRKIRKSLSIPLGSFDKKYDRELDWILEV